MNKSKVSFIILSTMAILISKSVSIINSIFLIYYSQIVFLDYINHLFLIFYQFILDSYS